MATINVKSLPFVDLGTIENSGGCTKKAHLFSTSILPDRIQLIVYEASYNGDNLVATSNHPVLINIKDNNGKATRPLVDEETGGVVLSKGKIVSEEYQKEKPTTEFSDYVSVDSVDARNGIKLEFIKKHYKL